MQSIKKFSEQEKSIPSRAALRYGSHDEHFKILIFLFDYLFEEAQPIKWGKSLWHSELCSALFYICIKKIKGNTLTETHLDRFLAKL